MARGGMLDKWVGTVVAVRTDREGIPGVGVLAGYDDLGLMLHIPSEMAEMLDRGEAPANASLIYIPWRIVEYVATGVEEPA